MQRPAAFSIDSTDERDSDMKSKTSTPRAINASINKNDGLSNSSSNSDPIASTTDQQEASQGIAHISEIESITERIMLVLREYYYYTDNN